CAGNGAGRLVKAWVCQSLKQVHSSVGMSATVRLECKHFQNDAVEHSIEAVSGADGYYTFIVPNDHEEEICYVKLIKSPRADCAEFVENREQARILLTENSGQANNLRYANALGFLKDVALPVCPELLKAYETDDDF
ncbi:pollen-specific protein C13-like, partial [Phalaenopsis equestris]|uniref:pollen-specific protein C13-like n=1 Tax=Phalaenopsis equestris TaxID=78828 RepID=UPI0009E600BE